MNNKIEQPKNMKRGRWIFFFIGLAVGIAMTISFFWIKKQIEKEDTFVINIFKPDFHEEKSNVPALPQPVEDKTPVPPTLSQKETDIIIEEEIIQEEDQNIESEEQDFEDVEFSIDTQISEEIFLFDEIIRNRQVSVMDHSIAFDSLAKYNAPYTTFEIQQWSTPIRNSITYQRENNILKIKGLNIDSITIYYRDGNYFLLYKNSSHIIPVNNTFEKIQ